MFSAFFLDLWSYFQSYFIDYIDMDVTLWLLMPLLITFLLPLVIVLLLYITALILYVYRLHRHRLRSAYGSDWRNAARHVVAAVWDAHGWIWHGYEVVGLENIPTDQPVLFVYYHGAIPIDLYYFISKVFLFNSKLIHTVADRFLFKCPGWSIISDVLKVIPGTIQTCSSILKDGNMLAISPGGVYEAQFGDAYYQLMWKNRLGFSKVALDAKVAIIPVFTKNIREAFRTISLGRRLWLRLYAATRFPFVPIYGGFPVKLKTIVGQPIPYDGSLTPEDLQIKVAAALDKLINENQQIPGSIFRALVERFHDFKQIPNNSVYKARSE
ncbi:transmembrane protein 68 [Trichogramma pretiosum]|uniref:Phospholipid/glycerol acyltransferase domain-containing protein n=1 Tax=Trichogramma kaykai TaxID=54128 RepID=A0ABD2X627_9HYME|nr:transmembrane protein 68 [Trichogramma pretiosum]